MASLWGFSYLAHADIPLPTSVYTDQCPFSHKDNYSFDPFLDVVKAQIEAKIKGRQECLAEFTNLQSQLNTIQNLYARNIDPKMHEEIAQREFAKALIETGAELTGLQALDRRDTVEYATVLDQKTTLQNLMWHNNIDLAFNPKFFEETSNNLFKSQAFSHVNNVILALAAMPPQCFDLIGGPEVIFPTLFNTAGLVSGVSGFGNEPAVGAALNLAASMSMLLTDAKSKKSVSKIIRQKNSETLACTYHAMKFSACEYRRAYDLSENTAEMLRLLDSHYADGLIGEYEKFFDLFEQRLVYHEVFDIIAAMGAPNSLDLDLIFNYIVALSADPESIVLLAKQPPPTDAQKQAWLNDMRTRRINFSEFVAGPGSPRTTLDQRIEQAEQDIANKKSIIESAESTFEELLAYVDLKHELESKFPKLKTNLRTLIEFLSNSGPSHSFLAQIDVGVIHGGLQLLTLLDDFLNIRSSSLNNYEDYYKTVNAAGRLLFKKMAQGAIAQIIDQKVVAVGPIASRRIDRVFEIIEHYYLDQELSSHDPNRPKYTEFKLNRALRLQILSNQKLFTGSNVAFRLEKVEQALSSFRASFDKEIRQSIEDAMNSRSEILSGLQGTTAGHLCALYNDVIGTGFGTRKFSKLRNRCSQEYKELQVFKIYKPASIPIDYSDPCFYPKYTRLENLQRFVFEHTKVHEPLGE